MRVAMVQVGPVRVNVLDRPMLVSVRVSGRRNGLRVIVFVMAVIVPVAVLVRHGHVAMGVSVTFAHEKDQGQS